MAVIKPNRAYESSFYGEIPEPGQVVEVRRRQWVVTDVLRGAVPCSSGQSQHAVALSSLSEEALGEEIQVIWQLEPGAKVLDKAGLPAITGCDEANQLEAFLDAVRWGGVTNADRLFLQSPFRSGITIEDYQLDPLVRAVNMARVNLLIADDVGLGKTIEAGLVIQEMLIRHRARTVLVVCPASLQLKWQNEMLEKFGLEFRIIDTGYIKKLRRERGLHANPWTSYPRLITSMDWAKGGEGFRLLKDTLPPHITYPRKFDILVVDEAHNVAPAAAAQYALESQRTKLIRSLAPHFAHRLFLTATPHNGYPESFTSLLELLDDQRFARTVMPDERQLRQVMVRRLKSDIVDADGRHVFPVRKLEPLAVDYSEEERQIHALLKNYTSSRSKSVKGSRFAYGAEFIHVLLKKRLFSSPMAFATTLAKHQESLKRNGVSRISKTMDERILHTAILKTQEEYSNDEHAEIALAEAVEIAAELSPPLSSDQHQMLDRLDDWAEKNKNRVDSKAQAILDWIATYLKPDDVWNDKRVILFTEYRATHTWLQQILSTHGYGGDRLMFLHGGMSIDEREPVKAAFQAHPDVSPVRILLATDAASEGIDLQNHCHYLIHVEIPWNPNVMEQRNGRIDRHGQKEPQVSIWHPVSKGFSTQSVTRPGDMTGDHEYLMRAVLKIDNIREDLGSVGPVIAKQIEEAMLGRRDNLDTSVAETKVAQARKFITAEKQLQKRITRLHDRLIDTQEDFNLSPANLTRAVKVALDLAGKWPLDATSLSGVTGEVFTVPLLPGSWGRAASGLEHPHTKERRPITFDHEVAKGRDDVVLAHLNHRLVQMCLRLLREEIWKMDGAKRLNRVTVYAIADDEIKTPVVAVWSRLVITGGDHHRLHEELTLSGGELKHEGFNRLPITKLESLLARRNPIEPNQASFDILRERFEKQEKAVMAAVEARSDDRLKHLESTIKRRMEKELVDVSSILDDLEINLRKELKPVSQDAQRYLPGLSPEETAQIRKDRRALESRLARIPAEREAEKSAIEKHYDAPVDRTFPVAVVFFVPDTQAWKK